MKEKYLKSEFNAVKCTRPRLVPMHMHIQVQTFVIFCIFCSYHFFFLFTTGKKGQYVWTDGKDAEALSRGVYNTYTKKNLRYSQV